MIRLVLIIFSLLWSGVAMPAKAVASCGGCGSLLNWVLHGCGPSSNIACQCDTDGHWTLRTDCGALRGSCQNGGCVYSTPTATPTIPPDIPVGTCNNPGHYSCVGQYSTLCHVGFDGVARYTDVLNCGTTGMHCNLLTGQCAPGSATVAPTATNTPTLTPIPTATKTPTPTNTPIPTPTVRINYCPTGGNCTLNCPSDLRIGFCLFSDDGGVTKNAGGRCCAPTPTATNTPRPTQTPIPMATRTPTPIPTNTRTPTPINTPTPTITLTPTAINTITMIPTPTLTTMPTVTPTSTPTPTLTPTPTTAPVMAVLSNQNSIFCPSTPDKPMINTALGCVPVNLDEFMAWMLPYLFGASGATAFLRMVWGFMKIAGGGGNLEIIKGGRDIVVAAIYGLLISIFALFALRLVAVGILKIPGLG